MRPDKTKSLRDRLKRGAGGFEFDALIQGVSTLEGEATPVSTPGHPNEGRSAPTAVLPLGSGPGPSDREGFRSALDRLGQRLLRESGQLRACLQHEAVEEAGQCLARANQVLELLHSMDPTGDVSRRLRTAAAPPEGRSWPFTAWSVCEFAESPLSALLPAGTGLGFVRSVVAAAMRTGS